MKLKPILKYLNEYLRIGEIQDASQNGLQVENSGEVTKIGLAVDASLEAFKKGKKKGVNFIIVHHGMFWGQPFEVTGLYYKRISYLIENNIGLYAAHLPLDLHPEIGNNAQIAKKLKLKNIEPFGDYHGTLIGMKGDLPKSLSLRHFIQHMKFTFKSEFKVLPFGKTKVNRVGIISGGGSGMVKDAVDEKVDVFITGETHHGNYHTIKEYKINCIFGGHYCTETFGVKALGKILEKQFNIPTVFLDSPTGM